jgi:hypothetical protein
MAASADFDARGERGSMRWEDWVVYGLTLAGIYLLVGILFFYSGKEKVIDNHGAPQGIVTQFKGTFIDTFPGINAAWWILGILESIVFLLVLISLVRLEFLPDRRKSWLLSSLALAIFTFSILAMGQNVTGQFSGVAQLYLYAGATGVLAGLVLLMPPYRRANWISGGALQD